MSWMHRVHEHRDFVVAHGIHQVFVARDERLLRFRIELARDDFGLVIFESQAMQQRDQPRAAFVDQAESRRRPGASSAAGSTRPRPSGPRIARRSAICGSVATATSTNPTPTATPAVHEEDRDLHHDHGGGPWPPP